MIRQDERTEELRLEMAPMIDMVFLLIIFFLTATSFTQQEREQDVLLPTNPNPGSLSRQAERNVVVNVLEDGRFRMGGRTVDEARIESGIRERREAARAQFKVLVRADRRTRYEFVARALAAVERAGVEKPYIVTKMVEIDG